MLFKTIRAAALGIVAAASTFFAIPATSAHAVACAAASVTHSGRIVPGTRRVVERRSVRSACRSALRRCRADVGHRRGHCEVLGVVDLPRRYYRDYGPSIHLYFGDRRYKRRWRRGDHHWRRRSDRHRHYDNSRDSEGDGARGN